jgi:hypothetical protein
MTRANRIAPAKPSPRKTPLLRVRKKRIQLLPARRPGTIIDFSIRLAGISPQPRETAPKTNKHPAGGMRGAHRIKETDVVHLGSQTEIRSLVRHHFYERWPPQTSPA